MNGILVVGSLPEKDGTAIPQKWALFDLDWTLIRPNKGKLHKNGVGWSWLPNRLSRLQDFVQDGYTLGIVTNAKPWPQQQIGDISQRLNQVYQDLQKYLCLYNKECFNPILAGLTDLNYRKPAVGWLNHIILLPGSLMVGDAAGRPCDFSDSDLKFAEAANIPFYTPEQVFPSTIPEQLYEITPLLLILMGAPGSGKTTFAQQLENIGLVRISSDDYGSNFKRIYSDVDQALQSGKQVIIDATNPTQERRNNYRKLAENYNIPSATVHFLDSGEQRNKYRGQFGEKKIPQVAYNTYWKNYQPPDPKSETVYEII